MKKIASLCFFTLLLTVTAIAQRTIAGTILDENQEPLVGANIVVQNSNPIIGVSTDMDGHFTIKVPEGYTTLVVTYIGYKNKEVELTSKNVYVIHLEPMED